MSEKIIRFIKLETQNVLRLFFLPTLIVCCFFNFANFVNAWCESGCFLRHSLLAPCLRIGVENAVFP